jgi:hypothetical protein
VIGQVIQASPRDSGEVIATFGSARLIKYYDRKYALVGGSEADRAEAERRISMFMKNDIVEGAPSPTSGTSKT